MLRLHQAVLSPEQATPVIPGMYPSMAQRGIHLRAGEISMIAGPPGAGKSSLALALAVRSGVPTVYFSADTTMETMQVRLLAMLTGTDQATVEAFMRSDRQWASDVLTQAGHIMWDASSNPTLERIELTLQAAAEMTGENPGLVVVDNAGDVAFDSGDEFSTLRTLMRELRWFARDTGAAMLVLHHTSEQFAGSPCPPQRALHGKIAQVPALILTVTSTAEPGFLGVAAVKNRYGVPSPDGSDPVWLRYDPARMLVEDLDEVAA